MFSKKKGNKASKEELKSLANNDWQMEMPGAPTLDTFDSKIPKQMKESKLNSEDYFTHQNLRKSQGSMLELQKPNYEDQATCGEKMERYFKNKCLVCSTRDEQFFQDICDVPIVSKNLAYLCALLNLFPGVGTIVAACFTKREYVQKT